MSDIIYKTVGTKVLIITNEKHKYHNIAAQVDGKWSESENGWYVKDEKTAVKFKRIVGIFFDDETSIYPSRDNTKDEIERPDGSAITTGSTSHNRRYRRAKSPGYSSDNSDECIQNSKILLNGSVDEFVLSSSDESTSSNESTSSDESPDRKPGKKVKYKNDKAVDKMSAAVTTMYNKKMTNRK